LIAKYGSYTHAKDAVWFSESLSPIYDEDGNLSSYEKTVEISGYVRRENSDTEAGFVTKLSAVEAAYACGGNDFIFNFDSGTRAYALLNTVCINGVKIQQPLTWQESTGAEFAAFRSFHVALSGTINAVAGASGETIQNDVIQYQYQYTDQKWTRTISGNFTVKDGVEPTAAWNTFIANYPTPSGYNRQPVQYTVEGQNVGFSIVDVQHWKALPSGVSSGGYTKQTRTDGEQKIISVSGSFTGYGASDAADAVKDLYDNYELLTENKTENEFAGSVSFSYEFIDPEYSGEYLREDEEVSISNGGTDFVLHERFEGDAVRQDTIEKTKSTATFTVTREQIGSIPDTPEPLWEDHLKPPLIERHSSKKLSSGERIYTGTWTFNYESPDNFGVTA